MKKILLCLMLFALYATHDSSATIRRVGFTALLQIAGVDYATVQDAVNASANGDSIYLYGVSASVEVSKKLTFIGTGYWTSGPNSNANLQRIAASSSLYATLKNGSSGCRFVGLFDIETYPFSSAVVCDSIWIDRCNSVGVNTSGYKLAGTGWIISRCYDLYVDLSAAASGTAFTNVLIKNSYISSLYNPSNRNFSGLLDHCNFLYGLYTLSSAGSSTFLCRNSTLPYFWSSSAPPNFIFEYCHFEGSSLPITGSNNTFNVDFNTGYFIGYPTQGTYANDARFQLAPGSPGIGAGDGGVDLGMFGGSTPYKLSGIPAIPAFYDISAPSTNATTNPYTITIGVRSNN